ncbi:MAG TPA: T9SS type A sorting domain-containing protein [Cryomorphaceae bacterium]|nr:T9SS type A sorting domain-containing protein [Cryomorphaceae bacterium]
MTKIRLFKTTVLSAALLLSTLTFGQSDLIVTALFDATLTGGTPKGVEIYAINDVADMSIYGIGSANNGGGTDGEEFTFPAVSATAGDFIYVSSDSAQFNAFFGFDSDYVSGALGINGDDAIELFQNGVVVDLYGDIDVDGSGQAWEYTDSWAYRANGSSPSGSTFEIADWLIPGPDALDGETTNASAAQPIPIGTFDPEGGSTVTVYTIQEIQETVDPSGNSPKVGEIVETSGTVTAVGNGGFWIQDGAGAWSGIFVLDGSAITVAGDDVTVVGAVQESNGLTRISATSVAVSSSGNPIPSATAVSTGSAGVEEFESVLLSISGAICVNPDAGFGEYVLNDGTGDYLVDDALFAFSPAAFAEYDAVGIGFFSFGNFKLLPRDADDIEDTGNNQLVVGFASDVADVPENAGVVSFDVNIINPSVSATEVDVVVTGGTAIDGVDFSFSTTTLNFAGSSTSPQSFSVSIINNAVENEDKTITFGLTNATNGALLLPDAFTLTILDDEIILTDIAVASATDADGVAINDGLEFNLLGVVLGINLTGSGQQFTLVDATGGIGVFSSSIVSDYVVTEGDQIVVTGTINQFNGLTQIAPSAIVLLSQGNPTPAPVAVTSLGEETESELVVFECATILDPTDWTNSGSGFNVLVSNGTDTITIRVDNNTDLYNEPAPTGEFDVVGIGGQFDFSLPFTDGYQLLPRSSADLLESSCATPPCENPFPAVDEASLNTTILTNNAVLTEWDAIPGQIGCEIQVALTTGVLLGSRIIAQADADAFVIPVAVLNPGTNYGWRVRCGCSQTPVVAGPFSSWQLFSIGSGIQINSSPNPSNGQSFVTFSVSKAEMSTLEVYYMNGKMVEALFSGVAQPESDYRFEFNGSNLPNGIYIYRLTTESEVKTEKFVISK